MSDIREQILARLVVVAGNVGANGLRNKINPTDEDLPAIIIHDGDEVAEERDPADSRPVTSPRRVRMTPAIQILVADAADAVGTTVNALRAKFINAVFTDATLVQIVLDRYGMRYTGCETTISAGRAVQASMHVGITFSYTLNPGSL